MPPRAGREQPGEHDGERAQRPDPITPIVSPGDGRVRLSARRTQDAGLTSTAPSNETPSGSL
jgi:hypothetical protein